MEENEDRFSCIQSTGGRSEEANKRMENLNIWKKSKMTDFWSKAVQKKNQVINESLLPISHETTESVTINDKTNPQPSTKTPPSTTNTVAPIPAQEEVKQKINTQNDKLVDLYRKRDLTLTK